MKFNNKDYHVAFNQSTENRAFMIDSFAFRSGRKHFTFLQGVTIAGKNC